MGPVGEATEQAIRAAKHLGPMDQGAVETLRVLAQKIDTEDDLRDRALAWSEGDEKRRPPAVDNVSIPTYLKFCESLGLTPAGRVRLDTKKESTGGKLAHLRAANKRAG